MDNFYDRLIFACIYSCRKFLKQIENEKSLLSSSSSNAKLLNGVVNDVR